MTDNHDEEEDARRGVLDALGRALACELEIWQGADHTLSRLETIVQTEKDGPEYRITVEELN